MLNNKQVPPPHRDVIRKILIIQQRPFGDVLLATSYIEALRTHYPQSVVDFFVSSPFDQVVAGHPFIRNVITSPAKGKFLPYLFGRLRAIIKVTRTRYDLAIDQQANAGSAIIVLLSIAKYRLGWKQSRGGRFFCNLKATPGRERYHGNRNFDMLAPLGIPEQPYRLYHTIQHESQTYIDTWLRENSILRKSYICICTQSNIAVNRWDANCFLKLITLIADNLALPIILTYAPQEASAVQSLAARSSGKARTSPPTTYNQAAALLANAKLLICLDGGLNHLSVATQTPTIAIFGKPTATAWSPQGVFPHHYHLIKPHQRGDTTLGIAPEEVFAVLRKLLDEIT